MIRCIIVDDEPLAQEVLERHIKQSAALVLVKICSNVLEAFNILHTQSIDLMFLDIQMPVINGIDFVRSLKNPPAIILLPLTLIMLLLALSWRLLITC
jgi:DNA-binding LytR/AlgR family response regulator